jgi:hypothetical protein
VWKPEGRRPLERPRRRWKNIKMDLRELDGGMNWIGLVQDRERGNEPSHSTKCGEFLE